MHNQLIEATDSRSPHISRSATPHKKRYQLDLPEDVYDRLQEIAERNVTTVSNVIRRFITLGLTAERSQSDPNFAFIVRDSHGDREIIMFP